MVRVPGEGLLDASRAWLDPRTVSRVIEPLVADWQHEWRDTSGWRRGWLRARYAAAFACALAWGVWRQARAPWPSELSTRLGIVTTAFLVVGVAVGYAVFGPAAAYHRAPLLVVPSLTSVALPLALLPAVIVVASGRAFPAWRQRTALLAAAVLCTLILVPFNGWLVPETNQRWRIANAPTPQTPLRGVHELTLGELASGTPPAGTLRMSAADIRTERHNRAAVALMPLTMLALGFGVARHARRRVWMRAGTAWLGATLAWLLLSVSLAPTVAGAWAAHLCFLSVAAALHCLPTGERASA